MLYDPLYISLFMAGKKTQFSYRLSHPHMPRTISRIITVEERDAAVCIQENELL